MNKNKIRTKKSNYKNNKDKDFIVKNNDELLSFLFKCFPSQSRNSIKSLLSSHQVLVNGASITQFNFKLYPKDVVTICYSRPKIKKDNSLPFKIIYEDDEFIVIDKPTRLLSIATDKEKGQTVYRYLTDYVQRKDKHNRVFIVHRLDEDTSGVMMVVKDAKLKELFTSNWNELVSKRGYYALVDGVMKEKEGTYSSYLKKNAQTMMYSSKDKKGQYAVTHFKQIKASNLYTLLDVNIDTGRKNQIRVHLFEHGYPVVGDDKYGEPSNPLNRLGLHAYELDIKHPITGKLFKFKSDIPQSFLSLFKSK